MSQETLRIQKISGHAAAFRRGARSANTPSANSSTLRHASDARPAKLHAWSGTTCRLEKPFSIIPIQTMPENAVELLNLILSTSMRGKMARYVADAQESVHALRGAGCLAACPSDGAIVQYTNGIVDFQQDNASAAYCITGCPFNIPN